MKVSNVVTGTLPRADTLLLNALDTSWADLSTVARRTESTAPAAQAGFDFLDEE